MPTVHQARGYRFFLFTNGPKGEPRIHVEQDHRYAKFTLQPIALERLLGFGDQQVAEIRKILEEHRGMFLMKWDEYVGR